MHEVVFRDAQPDAVRAHNNRVERMADAILPLLDPVDWGDDDAPDPSVWECSTLFEEEPEHREVEDLMNELGATTVCVRKVEG